jgi:hypothetical protein
MRICFFIDPYPYYTTFVILCENYLWISCLMILQYKCLYTALLYYPLLIAEPGFAPGPQGYEPRELLLLYPAIFTKYSIYDARNIQSRHIFQASIFAMLESIYWFSGFISMKSRFLQFFLNLCYKTPGRFHLARASKEHLLSYKSVVE